MSNRSKYSRENGYGQTFRSGDDLYSNDRSGYYEDNYRNAPYYDRFNERRFSTNTAWHWLWTIIGIIIILLVLWWIIRYNQQKNNFWTWSTPDSLPGTGPVLHHPYSPTYTVNTGANAGNTGTSGGSSCCSGIQNTTVVPNLVKKNASDLNKPLSPAFTPLNSNYNSFKN